MCHKSDSNLSFLIYTSRLYIFCPATSLLLLLLLALQRRRWSLYTDTLVFAASTSASADASVLRLAPPAMVVHVSRLGHILQAALASFPLCVIHCP